MKADQKEPKGEDDDSYASADLHKARVCEHHPKRLSQKALVRTASTIVETHAVE